MKILSGALTDKGVTREKNEDYYCACSDIGFYAVADGMGGHAAGERASRIAIEVISDYIRGNYDASGDGSSGDNRRFSEEAKRLEKAIKLANSSIYEVASNNESFKGMGTTIVAVLVRNGKLFYGHVGDSRIYLLRSGSMEQLTEDHSLVQEQINSGLLTEEEAKSSGISNIITRSLGIMPDVEVDLGEISLLEKDMIILCSDGLTSMLDDDLIFNIAKSHKSPQSACRRLVDMANEKGGNDNITVLLLSKRNSLWSLLFNKIKGITEMLRR